MVTIRIKMHVGFDEVVLALVYEHALFGWDLSQGRVKTGVLVRKFMAHFGDYGWANVSDELRDQFGKECAQRALELFPRLASEADLTAWGVASTS